MWAWCGLIDREVDVTVGGEATGCRFFWEMDDWKFLLWFFWGEEVGNYFCVGGGVGDWKSPAHLCLDLG